VGYRGAGTQWRTCLNTSKGILAVGAEVVLFFGWEGIGKNAPMNPSQARGGLLTSRTSHRLGKGRRGEHDWWNWYQETKGEKVRSRRVRTALGLSRAVQEGGLTRREPNTFIPHSSRLTAVGG